MLVTSVALLVTGCDEPSSAPATTSAPTPPPETPALGGRADDGSPPPASTASSDQNLVARAVEQTRRLAESYDGLAVRHPGTRRATALLRTHLREHLDALGDQAPATARRPTPRSRRRAVRALAAAEQAASAARLDDALIAASGDLARVLASMAASHAQHALILSELR